MTDEAKPLVSVLYDWVMKLGLRYQGVLVSAVRGCDNAPKHDPSKLLARAYRAEILRTHTSDPKESKSFIEVVDIHELGHRMTNFVRNWDHYPMHYVMHFVHAAQIVGYYHEDLLRREVWNAFYLECCRKLHMKPETTTVLANRLEANEDTFEENQREGIDTAAIEKEHLEDIERKLVAEQAARCKKCGESPCNCKWAGS